MTIKELNKSKLPIVKVDKKLEKLSKKILFPEKLEEANKTLKTAGVPTPKRQAKTQDKPRKQSSRRESRI
jgi:hypothetical protein